MKRSLVTLILLAAVAGATGVAIGLAMARARRDAQKPPAVGASHAGAFAPGVASRGDAKAGGKVAVIRFAREPAPTPPFLVADLDGQSVSTAALKGKVVIVNFWATWCPPCREEIPELVALQKKYKDQLQIIGVSMDEDATPAEVNGFAIKAGINYPVVMGKDIAKEYGGVPALPTSFVVNKDGGVVQKHVGLLEPDEIETEVRALLGLPVSATIETFADTGQIFLKNAERATELPDIDLTGLTASQKSRVLKRLNSETCTCGCQLTVAQCRINDTTCPVSKEIGAKIVEEVKSGASTPSSSAAPNHTGSSD
jgi:thiol-disulfide isomerase/thioredoxin